MSMQIAERAQLPLYKLTNPGHVVIAGGVQVEVRYYMRAYVRVGEYVFRHHFKILEILADVVLRVPCLRSYNPTVDWKERYADIRHGSGSYRLSFDESRDCTQLQFQAASKLHLLSTLSSSTSKVSPVGSPTAPAKEHPDLRSSTRAKSDANTLDQSKTEDGITDEECSDIEIEYISLPKLRREICRADLTGDQVFLCCMPRPALPVDEFTTCERAVTMTGLTQFDAICIFGYINGRVSTIPKERSLATYLGIDLGETTKYASKLKRIHRGYTLTKLTRAYWMSFDDNRTSCINLAKFDHPQVHIERAACW